MKVGAPFCLALGLAACASPRPQVLQQPQPIQLAQAAPTSPAGREDARTPLEKLLDRPPSPGNFSGPGLLPPGQILYIPNDEPWVGRFPKEPLNVLFPLNPMRPDDVAVVIGNADYARRGRDLPDVIPAYADAETFFRYAVATLGIRDNNIIEVRDAGAADLARLFGTERDPRGQLADWAKPGGEVYVYYSGHGSPGPRGEDAYLVPVDADAARPHLGGYPLSTLFANLEKLPAKHVTVVLEACFSGQSQGGSLVPAASGVAVVAKIPAPPSKVTVIAAGAADQIASWDQNRRTGLFTKHYILGMVGGADRKPYGNRDGAVSTAELKAYLAGTLTYEARRFYGRDQTAQFYAPEPVTDR